MTTPCGRENGELCVFQVGYWASHRRRHSVQFVTLWLCVEICCRDILIFSMLNIRMSRQQISTQSHKISSSTTSSSSLICPVYLSLLSCFSLIFLKRFHFALFWHSETFLFFHDWFFPLWFYARLGSSWESRDIVPSKERRIGPMLRRQDFTQGGMRRVETGAALIWYAPNLGWFDLHDSFSTECLGIFWLEAHDLLSSGQLRNVAYTECELGQLRISWWCWYS